MKTLLRQLLSPILNIFEAGDEPYSVKPWSRKILIVIGVLFLGLASIVAYLAVDMGDAGFMIPVVVFCIVSLVTLVVGFWGTDRAVDRKSVV